MEKAPLRVLVVDDSALMRKMLTEMICSDPELTVVDTAEDPYDAREKIKRLNPDVVTLDIEMPRMHGLDFLEKIMTLRPMPVVMISSLTTEGAEVTLRALELGAVDFIAKPSDGQGTLREKTDEVVAKVKAAGARVRPLTRRPAERSSARAASYVRNERMIVAVGASTGGVEALGCVLTAFPVDAPPILITHHMPERFVPSFSNRLNEVCDITVSEARDGELVEAGHAYISPGNTHLRLIHTNEGFRCQLRGHERVSGHCPSVDVLFQSVAKHAGAHAVGVILTGMGRDGASGMLAMRHAGARTIGQDEASALIYGMPKAAFEVGGVQEQVSLGRVAGRVLELCTRERVGG